MTLSESRKAWTDFLALIDSTCREFEKEKTPLLIERILAHLERPAEVAGLAPFAARAPPPEPPLL